MAMGLFQMKGGCEMNPGYELTAPMFSRIVVHLQPGCYKAKDLIITAGTEPEKKLLHRISNLEWQNAQRLVSFTR